MDIGEWLRGLSLDCYEGVFRDNKIGADVLPRLTADDLKEMGVFAIGDRHRILAAIAALAPAAPCSAEAGVSLRHISSRLGERRPVTVMFCDLVGSTRLAAKLDAEDWRNLVSAYVDEASAAVAKFGGHVLQRLGDGLMAVFGYPIAEENDAERAVRAALAIQRALADFNARNSVNRSPELSARIGLESGPVVVDPGGEVFGEAPNVAARVQAAAEPGSVLITANVHRQVAGLFVAEDKGARELKGVSQLVQLFRIVRASGARRRSSARTLTPFVGRDEELGQLISRWQRVRAGEGQFVLVAGEPGIGKSRLVEEFRARLGETPHTWVEWTASQLLQNTPLHPVAEWGRQRFGGPDVPAEARLADLESTLGLLKLDARKMATLLAPLVDIALTADRALNDPPEELRRQQLAALVAWVLAGARSQVDVIAFEDLQWADPTSLDLLGTLAELGAEAPLMIVATHRPEFRPSWTTRSHHSTIPLAPLDRSQVRRMVGNLAFRHALSEDVVEGVSRRTGGVPLYIEEVTRLLLERGEEGGVQAIPLTLQQSLAARLDRLGAAREIAQIGAVLGRDFVYPLLRDVAELGEPVLRASLKRLVDANVLFVEGAPPQANYRFKHSLIQDAAYASLLKSRRQTLHRRAAETLRDAYPERATAAPEAVARHFAQAGLDDFAIEWWGKAGDQAQRRSAYAEAITHLGKAIEMADKAIANAASMTNVEREKQTLRAKLQAEYAQAVLWSKGYAAQETKSAFERTGALAAQTESPAERFAALYGECAWHLSRAEMGEAKKIAQRFLQEAREYGGTGDIGIARLLLGFSAIYLGDCAAARNHLEIALASCARHDREATERYGLDPTTAAQAYLAYALWLSGDVRRSGELIDEAVRLGRELGHRPTLMTALTYKMAISGARNDPESVAVDAEDLLNVGEQHGMEFFVTNSRVYLSWARGRLDDPRRGADDLRKSLAAYKSQGNRLAIPRYLGMLAELEAAAGNAKRALALIDEGLAIAKETGEAVADTYLHRLKGEIISKDNPADTAAAEEAFRAAIAVARDQGARSRALLAALALAKLYYETAREAEARAVLKPALEGFSPTADMPQIAEAQALLAQLDAERAMPKTSRLLSPSRVA